MSSTIAHTVYIGVEHIDMANEVTKYLRTTPYVIYEGNKVKCFSELVNNCIKLCNTDIFIFCSHRVSPTDDDIQRLVHLLNLGFGYVGLYRFACFGIHMDIIHKIGMFDENFIPGECEDDDYKLRLQYNNIAFYEDHSVIYRAGISRWGIKGGTQNAHRYFDSKYKIDYQNKTINVQLEKSENIDRTKYKPFTDSILINVHTRYCDSRFDTFTFI